MKLELEFDVSAYEAQAEAVVERAIAPAIVDALNAAARAARLRIIEAMPAFLDRPTPFTTIGGGMFPATVDPASDRDPAALVRLMPQQANYMQYAVFGGERGPGDYASTALGPLVPGPDARLDAYGNLPREYVDEVLADGAAWVELKPGEPPALVRGTGGCLEILGLPEALNLSG
ncbi:hypothetical protein [Methylobacterium ajmalii]|jgi:hypothetical protein|uniref:hypothetical protein n=1 Tax=Methylobacterium ajmalii TaxID=2738439 RepID=UPI0019092F25|nr:hypothetical protein [Methylobacterium ajmalii]MBK3397773.1 hypothetical protein [Methylobacterium ajmalii]MBK3408456.1 hypothetical protein [Methylobacterium ajmalii]MBK3425850.1 hypothetical protein [Methylobacterium ajmalii]MBZ6416620.1 hypothetical protein [Methylobacterium sp.]